MPYTSLTVVEDPVFTVTDPKYGAKGDGVTDDAPAFQRAVTDAIAARGGLVYVPPSPVGQFYALKTTINITPASGTQAFVNFRSDTAFDGIRWLGASNTHVFHTFGWKASSVHNFSVYIPTVAGVTNVVVWDVDVNGTYTSTGRLLFERTEVNFAASITSCIGWRLGHSGGQDVSFITFDSCICEAVNASDGNTGWSNESQDSLQHAFINCGWSQLAVGITNVPSSGAVSANGGDSLYFFGCGGSNNALDFKFATPGTYSIFGGRFETGTQFMTIGFQQSPYSVLIDSIQIVGYTGSSSGNFIFDIEATGIYTLRHVRIYSGGVQVPGTAAVFVNTNTANVARLILDGVSTDAVGQFWANNTDCLVFITNSLEFNSGTTITAFSYDDAFYQTTAPTAAAGAQAGGSPPAPVVAAAATDRAGTLTAGTGTGPAAGAQVVVTFWHAYQAAPVVTVAPLNAATAALGAPYLTSVGTGGFTINTPTAPTASQGNTTYAWAYHVTPQ